MINNSVNNFMNNSDKLYYKKYLKYKHKYLNTGYKKKYFKYKYNFLGGMESSPLNDDLKSEIEDLLQNINDNNKDDKQTPNNRLQFYFTKLIEKLTTNLIFISSIEEIKRQMKVIIYDGYKFETYLKSNHSNKQKLRLQYTIEEYNTYCDSLNLDTIIDDLDTLKSLFEQTDSLVPLENRVHPKILRLLYVLGNIFFSSTDPKIQYLYIVIYPLLVYFDDKMVRDYFDRYNYKYFRTYENIPERFTLDIYKITTVKQRDTHKLFCGLFVNIDLFKKIYSSGFPIINNGEKQVLHQIDFHQIDIEEIKDTKYYSLYIGDKYQKFINFANFKYLGKYDRTEKGEIGNGADGGRVRQSIILYFINDDGVSGIDKSENIFFYLESK